MNHSAVNGYPWSGGALADRRRGWLASMSASETPVMFGLHTVLRSPRMEALRKLRVEAAADRALEPST
jgi:hypothetical protein